LPTWSGRDGRERNSADASTKESARRETQDGNLGQAGAAAPVRGGSRDAGDGQPAAAAVNDSFEVFTASTGCGSVKFVDYGEEWPGGGNNDDYVVSPAAGQRERCQEA